MLCLFLTIVKYEWKIPAVIWFTIFRKQAVGRFKKKYTDHRGELLIRKKFRTWNARHIIVPLDAVCSYYHTFRKSYVKVLRLNAEITRTGRVNSKINISLTKWWNIGSNVGIITNETFHRNVYLLNITFSDYRSCRFTINSLFMHRTETSASKFKGNLNTKKEFLQFERKKIKEKNFLITCLSEGREKSSRHLFSI